MHPLEHWRLLVQLPLQAAKPVLLALSWTAETVPAPSTAVTTKAKKPFLMSFGIGGSPFKSESGMGGGSRSGPAPGKALLQLGNIGIFQHTRPHLLHFAGGIDQNRLWREF